MTDFRAIISETDRYNFHSHTQYCDGHAPMADFAAAAVECGMRHYGFTPHSPVPFDSHCNMRAADLSAYLAEAQRIREQYAGQCRFYTAMEVDYLGPQWNALTPEIASLPLDYTISSVHFVPSDCGYVDIDGRFERFKGCMAEYFHNDIRHVVTLFYRQSVAMVEAGGFDVVGHPDKIGHNAGHFRPGIEEEGWYCRLVDELTDCIIASGLVVELNTKAWAGHGGRTFPSPRMLKKLKEAGVTVIVNSDAHTPALIDSGRAAGLRLLTEL